MDEKKLEPLTAEPAAPKKDSETEIVDLDAAPTKMTEKDIDEAVKNL